MIYAIYAHDRGRGYEASDAPLLLQSSNSGPTDGVLLLSYDSADEV
jgi:hypothetical protein